MILASLRLNCFVKRMLSNALATLPLSHISEIIRLPTKLAVLLGLAALSSCATPPAYPPKQAAECEYTATKEGVTIGVHPVFDQQELSQYFKTDLVDRGILPVLIVAQNDSRNATYALIRTNCWLAGSFGFGSKEDLSTRRTEGALIGGIPGGLIMADATNKRTGMADKELNDQTVSPGETARGFVYMKMGKEQLIKGVTMTMQVRLEKVGAQEALDFTLPITWRR